MVVITCEQEVRVVPLHLGLHSPFTSVVEEKRVPRRVAKVTKGEEETFTYAVDFVSKALQLGKETTKGRLRQGFCMVLDDSVKGNRDRLVIIPPSLTPSVQ